MEIDTIVIHVATFDCITPDRYCIKILGIYATVGIGECIAADLQTRWGAAAIITV